MRRKSKFPWMMRIYDFIKSNPEFYLLYKIAVFILVFKRLSFLLAYDPITKSKNNEYIVFSTKFEYYNKGTVLIYWDLWVKIGIKTTVKLHSEDQEKTKKAVTTYVAVAKNIYLTLRFTHILKPNTMASNLLGHKKLATVQQ